jgi:carbamoyltransferase
MYEATTRSLGLGILDAGKTMGLASYGSGHEPVELPIGDLRDDGPSLFDLHPRTQYQTIVDAWTGHLADRFGAVTTASPGLAGDEVAVRMAASAQQTVETAMHDLHAETRHLAGVAHVCLAGGVALNSVVNGQLPEPLYIPPFPHDAGVALGAAWSVCPPATAGLLRSPYLGAELGGLADAGPAAAGLDVSAFTPEVVLELLVRGRIGAVAEGRAEVGPRALGHRSIVALPREPEMRDRLNAVKRREEWRPFAPVTLPDYASQLWPRQGLRELYMIGNATVSRHALDVIPAAVHVDATTRPQVLPPNAAPVLESLLEALRAAGLPPVLVNTSFNGPGEPIVNTASDAVHSFRELGLDFLVIGDCLVQAR